MDIISKRYWYFLLSGVLIILAIISLSTLGLKYGIEFSSGYRLTIVFDKPVEYSAFQQEITKLGYTDAIIQSVGTNQFIVRIKEISDTEKNALQTELNSAFGSGSLQAQETTPGAVANTPRNAIISMAVALVGILIYVTVAFRKMPWPFRFGVCSVIALFHDILVTAGLFSLFGAILGWEINLMFITGILTIIGYSINNTIVVFDRIRENKIKGISPDFEIIANNSVVETMGRSFNTSLTVLITTLALLLFVGTTIQNFAVVLLIGNIVGTYDSVFVAPSLLVVWDKREWGRFIGRRPLQVADAKGR
jgi:preprotein translocase subunit SecF